MTETPPPFAPLPSGGLPPTEPIYRQDEFVRRATTWTRPMQVAVAAYFVISALVNVVGELVFANDLRALAAVQVAKQYSASGRAVTAADIKTAVDLGVTVALVFSVIFALVFIALAILSLMRARTWVFWVDFVFLCLGILSLLSTMASFGNATNSSIPAGLRPISLISGLADLGLVIWMSIGLVKYGPWAQEKAPATL